MTVTSGPFKPVFQSNFQPASCTKLIEPPFAVPVAWTWGQLEVDEWLVRTGYGRYRSLYHKNSIAGERLLSTNAEVLRRLGVQNMEDAVGMERNIQALNNTFRPLDLAEFPEPPFTHYRSLYFGEQAPVTGWPVQDKVSHTCPHLSDQRTRQRIQSIGGDPTSWFVRNRPHYSM